MMHAAALVTTEPALQSSLLTNQMAPAIGLATHSCTAGRQMHGRIRLDGGRRLNAMLPGMHQAARVLEARCWMLLMRIGEGADVLKHEHMTRGGPASFGSAFESKKARAACIAHAGNGLCQGGKETERVSEGR